MIKKLPKVITEHELRHYCHCHDVHYESLCIASLKDQNCGVDTCGCPVLSTQFVCAQEYVAHHDEMVYDWHVKFIRE